MDDNLEMASLTTAFGGEWMPILSGKDHRKQPTDDLFVVEVRDSDVTVVQHERHTFPQVCLLVTSTLIQTIFTFRFSHPVP